MAFTAVVITTARVYLDDGRHTDEQVDDMHAAFAKSVMLHVTVWTRAYTAADQW